MAEYDTPAAWGKPAGDTVESTAKEWRRIARSTFLAWSSDLRRIAGSWSGSAGADAAMFGSSMICSIRPP